MKILILGLSIAIAAVFGFAGGCFVMSRYLAPPGQVFVRIQAEAFTTLVDLTELRSGKAEGLIQLKEIQLDTYIISLAAVAKEGGTRGKGAIQILRRIAAYRKSTGYIPESKEAQQWVNDAFQLANRGA
jgi:hypothetical protein